MKNGLSRRGPFSLMRSAPSAIPSSPPMPDPIMTPVRSRDSSSVGFQPESSTAWTEAAIAKRMKGSTLRWSLGGIQSSALK